MLDLSAQLGRLIPVHVKHLNVLMEANDSVANVLKRKFIVFEALQLLCELLELKLVI